MNSDAKRRMKWVSTYQESGDAGLTCRRCGISRPTLRKWLRRFEQGGLSALETRSSRPLTSPHRKVNDQMLATIVGLRDAKNIGARRIQIEMGLSKQEWLSRTIIQRALDRAQVRKLRRPKRPEEPKRYARPVPGDRVQLDTMKLASGVYQYTAVDDCSRYRVLALHSRRSAKSTIAFLERVIEEMPFPIQRVQTDRGTEFFAQQVQEWLSENFIKFRPVAPRSPHLNGKVERSQLTDKQEFWANRGTPSLADAHDLECWQFDYNWRRPHGSLNGRTPIERIAEVGDQIPDREAIAVAYNPSKEPMRFSNWAMDGAVKRARTAQSSNQSDSQKT